MPGRNGSAARRRTDSDAGAEPVTGLAGLRLVCAALALSACGTQMAVTPAVEPVATIDFTLLGTVVYDGKPEYLPRTVAHQAAAPLTLRYIYEVAYGKDKTHEAAVLFNPLTLIGFPIGQDTVAVSGRLEISRGNEVAKTYTATSGFEKTRNLFYEGDTFSELRLRGLQCVRENIEAQMQRDRDVLSTLSKVE